MNQLREFAQHKADFDQLHARVVALSVDDQEHAHLVWEKVVHHNFPILSDPGAVVIRQYGLLHARGHDDADIALRTTLLIDDNGIERWRRVSANALDIPKAADALQRLREMK